MKETRLKLDATTAGWLHYQWRDGHFGARRELYEGRIYSLTATDAFGCSEQAQIELLTQAPLPIPIQPIYQICLGDSVFLKLNQQGFSDFQWADSVVSDERKLWEAGVYGLQATDPRGCPTFGRTEIIVDHCPYDVYMPNAFSPNNDGHNDWFSITYRSDIQTYHLMIFNRWGKRVYDSRDPNPGWDGTYKGLSCPEGVYVYLLNFTGLDGNSHQKRGTITLIR